MQANLAHLFTEARHFAVSYSIPTAILSRQVGVIRKQALILNLPGQPKSIKETLEGLKADDGSVIVHGIFASVPYCIYNTVHLQRSHGRSRCRHPLLTLPASL